MQVSGENTLESLTLQTHLKKRYAGLHSDRYLLRMLITKSLDKDTLHWVRHCSTSSKDLYEWSLRTVWILRASSSVEFPHGSCWDEFVGFWTSVQSLELIWWWCWIGIEEKKTFGGLHIAWTAWGHFSEQWRCQDKFDNRRNVKFIMKVEVKACQWRNHSIEVHLHWLQLDFTNCISSSVDHVGVVAHTTRSMVATMEELQWLACLVSVTLA